MFLSVLIMYVYAYLFVFVQLLERDLRSRTLKRSTKENSLKLNTYRGCVVKLSLSHLCLVASSPSIFLGGPYSLLLLQPDIGLSWNHSLLGRKCACS